MKRLPAAMAILVIAAIGSSGAAEPDGFCLDCLSIRLDRPMVVRGPFPDELDNAFTALKLADGSFRGFSANGNSYAVGGADITSMGGPRRTVMEPGAKGSPSDCGRWLNSVLRAGPLVYGLVHQESGCDYRLGQTHKSMAMAVSPDKGLTWTDLGDIITGSDAPKPGAITGEGDCTMVDGHDGYVYAYCLRNSDWRTIAARAPDSGLGPGHWRKYRDGKWDADALGGEASAMGFNGVASAFLKEFGRVALIANDPWFGGLRLSVSADKAHFTDLGEPLLPVDGSDWDRPAPADLVAYMSFLDPADGTNVVGNHFLLAMVYVPPGKDFAHRYLVLQPVRLEAEPEPVSPQVAIALSRWRNTATGGLIASTGPMVGEGSSYAFDSRLGYLMTRAPDGVPSIRLEECTSGLLSVEGTCGKDGSARLRTAGWAYAGSGPGTLPLYRCRGAGGPFVSNAPDCEGAGALDVLLGYALES